MSETVLKSLNAALHAMMGEDERVILIGEDLLDPYGGAFKVSKGLSTAYPARVWTSPISEAGFTGVAAGMAMRGLRPIVEIMFGDFLMLAADQLLNHITKYRWMYNDQVDVPIVIRAPMGGRRGYGPTHSQTIEKHFIGMPGLVVVAPSPFHVPGDLLRHAVLEELRPVVFVENKLMYSRRLRQPSQTGQIDELYTQRTKGPYPTVTLSYDAFEEADVTLVAYGGMAELAVEATKELLMHDEIYCEVVIPSLIQSVDLAPIVESLGRTGRLVVCEEATGSGGWGADVIARVSTQAFESLKSAPVHVAAREFPIANAHALEEEILPQRDDIIAAVRAAHRRKSARHLAIAEG
ncbi:MAG: alpha-ketoacid dehydrogenase subunit beta [Bradymonadaceae bacterium]